MQMPHIFLSRLVQRMAFAVTLVLLTLGLIAPGHAADTMIKVTDLAGRTVTVKKGVQRAILGEGRLFYATVVLNKEKPFAQLAAIGDDLPKFDPDTWNQYLENVPDAKNATLVSALASSDFSVEKAVALDADLIVLSLGFYDKAKETGILDNLEKAGIPTIFIDFRERPTQNAVPSMMLLGRVFDRQDQAQEFVDFYTRQMRRIYNVTNRLKQNERPLVFAEQAAGLEPDTCCRSFGNFNFGEFVSEAGGLGTREPCADANSLGRIATLGDRRAEVVERCQGLAVRVRDEQPNVLEAVGEELGDPLLQRVETVSRSCRDEKRTWIGVLDPPARERVQRIDLVQNELHRDVVGADLGQDAADRGDRLRKAFLGE